MRTIRRIAAISILAIVAACSADSPVLPSSNSNATVSLAIDSISLRAGDSLAPMVRVTTQGVTRTASTAEVTLASSNASVATVTVAGEVVAVGAGRATITASWKATPAVYASAAVVVSAVAMSGGSDPGYVQIRWIGSTPSAGVAAAFEAARVRLSGLFNSYSGVAALNPQLAAGTCLTGTPAVNETVNGIIIFAQVTAIDGLGNILGSAGPCILRESTNLPIVATMQFDSVDMNAMISDGTLNDVVLHEMMHTLGFGTIWSPDLQGEVADPEGADPRYLGANGQAGYVAIGGTDDSLGVPVENLGGTGTAGVHWRESVFGTELMTGWANGSMKMSRATVGALKDFGYDVDVNKADNFMLGDALRSLVSTPVRSINEHTLGPIGVLGHDGRITPYRGTTAH